MKINLDGLEGIPSNSNLFFEDDQSVELCSNLSLDEVSVIFATPEKTRAVYVAKANSVKIPIPEEMLVDKEILSISVDLIIDGKVARKWNVKPFVLTAHESGLEATTFDFIKEVQAMKERLTGLEGVIFNQSKEIAMLKERINPLKDVL